MTERMPAIWANYHAERCREKQFYSTKLHAKRSARATRKRFGFELNPYLCRWCRKWHLTSKKGPR